MRITTFILLLLSLALVVLGRRLLGIVPPGSNK